MALLFNGFVTNGIGTPTPSPAYPIDNPNSVGSISAPLYDAASFVPPLSVPNLDVPNVYTPESVGIIDLPTLATDIDQPSLDLPSPANNIAQPSPDLPSLAPDIAQPSIDLPSLATNVIQPSVDLPSALSAVSGTQTTPPFPLKHARILWDNLLVNYDSVSVTTGINGADAIIPNTFERWIFTGGAEITITLPANVDIDTICVCAHNLGDNGYSVGAEWSGATTGSFTPLTPGKNPTDNKALMFHYTGGTVSARRIKILCSGSGDSFIGYITAGIALQMQRPFWGNYTPVCENLDYQYYDSWTRTGQLVGRSERAVMLSGSYSWSNIDDTWYRAYFEPFKNAAHSLPFVFAWNLDEFPNDVEMVLPEKISAAPYNGTRKLRSINISVKGVA